MAMFSNTRPTASSSGNIVEFKAGRSRLEAGNGEGIKNVVAEQTKGLVFIKQSNDMLVHFCWKNRETGALVDDLIIFPDDAEFKPVHGCPDGKVFMLKFKSSGEMKVFWLQDTSPDADKDLVKKVNDALNKPPTSRPSASRSSGSNANADRSAAGGSLISGQDFNAMGGLDQGQLMSLIQSLQGGNSDSLPLPSSGSGGTKAAGAAEASSEADCEPPAASGAPSSSSNAPLSLDNPAIAKIFSNLQRKDAAGLRKVHIPLSDVLSNEVAAEAARQNADLLVQHLPQSDDPAQELSETVRTPQFRQASDLLGHALESGQLGQVLSQFDMNKDTIEGADNGSIITFAKELTRAEGGHLTEDSSPMSGVTKTQPDDDVAREPEPKRNRPDDDMDVD
uniref:Proteasomal ubiquitin receptor ADRM1 homolog n=1 Tax=Caenorhabditis tropicalis TaxID=1561998 RepID=A0A1I7U910_9PELO